MSSFGLLPSTSLFHRHTTSNIRGFHCPIMAKEETILRKCDRWKHITPCWKKCVGCGYTLCMFCQVYTLGECPVCGGYFIEPAPY